MEHYPGAYEFAVDEFLHVTPAGSSEIQFREDVGQTSEYPGHPQVPEIEFETIKVKKNERKSEMKENFHSRLQQKKVCFVIGGNYKNTFCYK